MIALTPATLAQVRQLPLPQLIQFWDAIEAKARADDTLAQTIRALTLNDLYYLLVRVCRRVDMLHPWVYARVREVELNPDDHLDLWARGHFKSSIGTFGLTIQKILRDPEITVGIFSHTRPIAKAFLRQIMREFESNLVLQNTFPDVLWGTDTRQAPKWSEDDGIIVKRRSNPPESTIEAWGLVDGQPTSRHFKDLVYDDIVVEGSVTTPEMIEKTQKGLEQSYNLVNEKFTRRFYGTRWHHGDAYRTIIERKTATPRIHPGTDDGTEDGAPVFWSEELLAQKRRDMGPHTFCLAAGMRILMGDWSWKPIEQVKIDDEVVGYEFGKKAGLRTTLVRTKVVATSSMLGNVTSYVLASGGSVRCTPNHKWWSGRRGKDAHRVYAQLGDLGYRDLHGLVKITDVFERNNAHVEDMAWLAGMIDGEGTISPQGQVVITQSDGHNPAVCKRIEDVLARLGISYKIYQRKPYAREKNGSINCKASRLYVLAGGRPMKHRIISTVGLAKREVMLNRGLYGKIGGRYALPNNDKVVSSCVLGEQPVFNLETGTGNYITEGYCSKNSAQILLNPRADALQGFKREWLRHYKSIRPEHAERMVKYLLVDPASAKKKGSDYTTMWAIGLHTDQNYYALDFLRDRLSLTERADRLFTLHRKWKPLQTRYESYGMQADIEHIRARQETESYRFEVTAVAGQTKKQDRIGRLIPLFEQHRIWLPTTLFVTNYEKTPVDLVRSFIEEEYMAFPVSIHDDMLDSLSRIAEPDLNLVWPKEKVKSTVPQNTHTTGSGAGWMSN